MNIITEQMLYEDKGGKNLHLEHIEDEILNYGIDGGRASINFIQSLRDMFAGAQECKDLAKELAETLSYCRCKTKPGRMSSGEQDTSSSSASDCCNQNWQR